MNAVGNPQLELAFNFVQYTDKNIFLTGKAGTGKTTFLHNLKLNSPKRMIVVAPTGVAAINAGGVTIHSFFQLPFGPYIPHDQRTEFTNINRFGKDKINILKSLDLLVIDEISMVRADLLDGIDSVLRRYKNKFVPFGGVQLLMIGDLQQLAPVVKDDEWAILKDHYSTMFFFSSKALQLTKHVTIELRHIYRQRDSNFIAILNKVRENQMDVETLLELNKRYIPDFNTSIDEGYITLTTHNAQAQILNESKLQLIPGKSTCFKAVITSEFPDYAFPTEFALSLKVGAQVMFVKNDSSKDKLFYNGKIGVIKDIEDDTIFVKCEGDEDVISVEPAEWQNTKYTIDTDTKEIKESVAGTFVQYPLKLAWAITIHKSQGLTFEKAIIDANAAFAHGQVYVALSRCKTLEGLVLSNPIALHSIKSDSTLAEFNRNIELNPIGNDLLEISKLEYQQSLILDLFSFFNILRRAEYIKKITREHSGSLASGSADIFISMCNFIMTDLCSVAEKFHPQLRQLLGKSFMLEENVELQKRIKSASKYFLDKMDIIISQVLEKYTIETDNKTVLKSVKEALGYLKNDSLIKVASLSCCLDGFTVKNLLETRAKASIEKENPKKQFTNTFNIDESKVHPNLYSRLKEWRNQKADELNVSVFMIIQVQTMQILASTRPQSISELKKIKGLGKKKIETYGLEILSLIQSKDSENITTVNEQKLK